MLFSIVVLRRLLAAVCVMLALGTLLAPAAAEAFGHDEAHLDCCCPDPALCPVVNGKHTCAWKKEAARAAELPDTDGPRLERCPGAADAAELVAAAEWLAPAAVALSRTTPTHLPRAVRTQPRTRGADAPETPPPRA